MAIANYGTLGTKVWSGSKIIGEGSPTNLNRLVPYNTVQEQSVAWGAGGSFSFFDTAAGPGAPPEIRLRFTDLAQLANAASGWTILTSEGYSTNTLTLTDCQLRGGYLSMYSASSNAFPYVAFTNNLALRTDLHFTQGYQTTPYPASLYLRNNLFWGGSLSIVALSANNTWEAKDNLFDTVSLSTTNSATFANSNNGYYQTTQLPGGSNNKTLTAVDFQTGPLSSFYYPTTGTNLNSLRDAGSVTNAGLVGLYHYTTTTNQVKETNSVLDIGAHFVALNAAGNPIDSDNDGLPDYFENTSGSGVVGAGETDYLNPDTDLDGRNDYQEFLEGTNPLDANSFTPVRLGYWRFNTNTWASEEGRLPLLATNVSNVAGFDRNSLQINNTNVAAILKYRTIETNGLVSFTPLRSTIRFWYKPFWQSTDVICAASCQSLAQQYCGSDLACQSNYFAFCMGDQCYWLTNGTGPENWVRLFEVGQWTADSSIGLFALSIDPYGTNLVFQTQDGNGHGVTNVQAYASPYFSDSNHWHEIILQYDSGFASLTIDGQLLNSASNPDYAPTNAVLAAGFSIGSSTNGSMQAQGMIDELEIFNYSIGPIGTAQGGNVMSATVNPSPPSIQLDWRIRWLCGQNQQQPKTLTRRTVGSTNWTTLSTNITGLTFADTNAAVGSRYEYQLQFNDVRGTQEYILAGINATPIDYRGKVILLVDQTLTNALATNLTQLTQDLVGDGWKVIRHDAPRHDDATWANNTNNIAVIKGWITNDYNSDPTNMKAIYSIGHVSIPFSGWLAPDGHPPRPWPADSYFGSIGETNWTDSSVNQQTNGVSNIPGDGIFDQNSLPKNQFLAVGRVDFANMPAFNTMNISGVPPKSETDLVMQYLNKNHGFRIKAFQFADRSVAASSYSADDLFASADRTASRLYGLDTTKVEAGDPLAVTKNSHLFGFAAGYGNPSNMSVGTNNHYSADLADPGKEPLVGFYVLSASYFGAWHLQDDFLRAAIATPTYGLEAVYALWQAPARQINLGFEAAALGEPIAAGVGRTITNGYAEVEFTLMGDPTLRFQVVGPASGLTATTNSTSVNLAWTASAEPSAQYFVYRSTNGIAGDFLRLSQAINSLSYTDSSPPAGQKMYQLRAAKLVTTGSGSFTNLSQGVFTTVNQ